MKKQIILLSIFVIVFLSGCTRKVEIIFESEYGDYIPPITNKEDFNINNLPVPIDSDYVFIGWCLDESCIIDLDEYNVPKRLQFTLYAKWIKKQIPLKRFIYFEGLNGEYIRQGSFSYYEKGIYVEINSFEEYEGFVYNPNHEDNVTSGYLTEEFELRYHYNRFSYELKIDSNGGENHEPLILKYNEKIPEIKLKKEGYQFDGWKIPLPEKMPAKNLEVVAKWKPALVNYKVEHYVENSDNFEFSLYEAETFQDLTGNTVKAKTKFYDFFRFEGLIPTNKVSAVAKADGTCVLELYYRRNKYNITYTNIDEPIIQTYKYDATIKKIADPVKEGYTFGGWYLDCNEYIFDKMPPTDITLNAMWIKNIN